MKPGYNVTRALRNRPLKQGKDKADKPYPRKINFPPGYSELANVVAGLHKDVKRINQCLTLAGAKKYADKRKNWQAFEEDITGPHGKPDGIEEVLVTDAHGNVRVVNGMTLRKSVYPWRKLYQTAYPTKESRKGHPFQHVKRRLKTIAPEFDDNGKPYYEFDPAEVSPEFRWIQPEIKPKDVFKQLIFKEIYDSCKDTFRDYGLAPMLWARIFNMGLTSAYVTEVNIPVASEMLGVPENEVENLDQKTANKVMKSDEFKKRCMAKMAEILKDEAKLAKARQSCQTGIDWAWATVTNQQQVELPEDVSLPPTPQQSETDVEYSDSSI